MALDFDATQEEIQIFLAEAKEQIETLEEGIMSLEQEQGDIDAELLQSIFRAAHTLKGSSAALGHVDMAKLTHEMENILDHLRKNTIDITPELIGLLLGGIDALRIYANEIYQGKESGYDSSELVESFKDFVAASLETVKAPAKETPAETEKETPLELVFPDDLKAKAFQLAAPDKKVFEIGVQLETENTLPSVRAYQLIMLLEDLGKLVFTQPGLEELEQFQDGKLKALLVTTSDAKTVKAGIAKIPDCKQIVVREAKEVPKAEKKTSNVSAEVTEAEEDEQDEQPKDAKKQGQILIAPTIRVDVSVLDDLMNLVGELVIDRTRLTATLQKLQEGNDLEAVIESLAQTGGHIGRVTENLQDLIMKARLLPMRTLFRKFPRVTRDLATKAKKKIRFEMSGEDTEIDRSVIEQISDPIIHLLRNAIDHGIEMPEERERLGKDPTGTISLIAEQEESYIVIRIKDDGKGIDPEKIVATAQRKGLITRERAQNLTPKEAVELIFLPGFSTAEQVTQVSGRGVGMDIVRKNIENLSGNIQIITEVGKGTEFRIELPLTLAIMRTLLFESSNTLFSIALSAVAETNRVSHSEIKYVNKQKAMMLRGRILPLIHIEEIFDLPAPEMRGEHFYVIVVRRQRTQVGIIVEKLLGEEEVVVKTLSKLLGDVRGLSGATILGHGEIAFILDVPVLLEYGTDGRVE